MNERVEAIRRQAMKLIEDWLAEPDYRRSDFSTLQMRIATALAQAERERVAELARREEQIRLLQAEVERLKSPKRDRRTQTWRSCGHDAWGTCSTCYAERGEKMSKAEAELARVRAALEESVKLQSHYAEALNLYDGGRRIVFKDSEDWLARLAMTPEERVKDAERRAALEGRG